MNDVCRPEALRVAAGQLTGPEIDALLKQLRKRKREIAADSLVTDQDAALRAADELAREAELAAVLVKRNEALNLAARTNLVRYVREQWADRPVEGIEARLAGVARARPGARRSIAADQRATQGAYVGGLLTALHRAGVLEVFSSGALDREVARALFLIDQPDQLRGINPDAVKIARAVHEWQERARLNANKAGAWIAKLPGYIVRQSHDAWKISKAGFETWFSYILPRLDLGRTFPEVTSADELRGILREVWRGLSTGVHLTAEAGQVSGFRGPGNIAKKLSQERVLHFLDADAWFDYNGQFGSGNLREAIAFGLSKMARTTALMRGLGTNPRANLEAAIGELQKGLDEKGLAALDHKRRWLTDTLLGHIDGTANMTGNRTAARFAANLRALESMAKLGGAVLSAVADLPVYASELRYQGRGMLSGLAEAIGGLRGRRDQVSQETLASLGVFFDSISGELVSRFSADDSLSGLAARGMRQFFRLNLLNWWTDSLRATAGLSMSHHLALHVSRDFASLPADLQRVLSLYGIDSPRWDLMRSATLSEHDGRAFLTTEGLAAIPDERLAAYLEEQGKPSAGRAPEALREELATQLRQYIVDRVDYAVISPDVKTRAYMLGPDEPGSLGRELRAMIAQFKAFPFAVVQRVMRRELFGRGADTAAQALRNGNGEMVGFASTLALMTLFGYGAMALKDLAKGREPRNPLDPQTWSAAMLQGGALGLYGDFLLGESSRFNRSLLETVAGPVPNLIADVDEIRAAAMAGDDVAARSFKLLKDNTPFLNLFYTRMALDYLFLYQVQEALNPGSIRRMERRIERENNQRFLLPPSEVVR